VTAGARGRVVILDRDGTIVIDRGYLDDPAGLQFLPGAEQGLRRLHQQGYRLVVITNQSGIGRGLLTVQRLEEIHGRLAEMLDRAGAPLEGIYYCPHRPEDDCACRKPKAKLLRDAAAALGFDPASAIVIGDKRSDVELGQSVGALTMLVSQNGATSDGARIDAGYVVRDLLEAARILEDPSFEAAPRRPAAPGR